MHRTQFEYWQYVFQEEEDTLVYVAKDYKRGNSDECLNGLCADVGEK